MQVEDSNDCFVCGDDNPNGMHASFSIDYNNNSASCDYTIPSHFQGWHGIAHGGILATLLDETCVYACRPLAKEVVTAAINLRYKKPVPVATPLRISAEVCEQKKRYFVVSARIEIDGVVHTEADAKVFIC